MYFTELSKFLTIVFDRRLDYAPITWRIVIPLLYKDFVAESVSFKLLPVAQAHFFPFDNCAESPKCLHIVVVMFSKPVTFGFRELNIGYLQSKNVFRPLLISIN